MYRIELKHNFETAHRLASPTAPVKCVSIHGHSWLATATICGNQLDADGILVEFGAFKRAWRRWLDDNFDHALLLRRGDPMEAAVRGAYAESRIFVFDENPTTEVIARYLWGVTRDLLTNLAPPELGARLEQIHIRETRVNSASWTDEAEREER